MKQFVQQLYESMLEDLQHCRQKGLYEMEEIECCFQICIKYWALVRERLVHYQFDSQGAEIDFFKNSKPRFLSKVEYYNLLYHAQLFQPDYGSEALKKFWQREALRLEKFREENGEFYRYYKSGLSCKDDLFFVRTDDEFDELTEPRVYDMEPKARTSHDYLVSMLLALEDYQKWVLEQMEKE